ncbi:MAG: hypothetical protein A6F71_07495 [Cycloclasticus sp. symbiont of Poecilosclerida sp. M]|nr:MAG: hypothetical protein A6F71_07495 [Cycloclasticus sp. symbiont of Poecilosclerida sp. M]
MHVIIFALIIDTADLDYLLDFDAEKLQHSSALYLLKLKEQRCVSQVAIDDIVEGSRVLFLQLIDRVKAGMRAKLAEAGLDYENFGLAGVFKNMVDPFDGIHTSYLQEKYLWLHELVVKLLDILLLDILVWNCP